MIYKCNETITRKQQDYLARLAELSIEAVLGGKNSLSYRVLFRSCCDDLDDNFEEVFGTTELSELRACQFNDAVKFLAEWFPSDIIMEISVDIEADFEKYRYRFVEEMPKDSPAYKQLMEDFERSVNKGEKGIQIFAPAPYKIKKEQTKLDPDTDLPVLGKDGKPIKEEVEVTIPAFKVVSVFDVSQTSGKELPTLGADELSGNVKDYEKFFNAVREASPVPIKFAEIDGTAKGFYHHEDKSITIKENMSEVQTIKTAIHEIAHAKLHDRDLKKSDVDKPKDRSTEEVEAESIAYTVCQHFGIDTSDYSFAYVASWGSGKDTPELKSSLETIRSTASELITAISDKYLGLEKDKTQEQTADKSEKSNIIGNTAYMRFSPEAKQIADKFEYPDKDSVHSFTHLYVTDIKPSVI